MSKETIEGFRMRGLRGAITCKNNSQEAIEEGKACKIFLKKTNNKTLDIIPLEKLKKFAIDLS